MTPVADLSCNVGTTATNGTPDSRLVGEEPQSDDFKNRAFSVPGITALTDSVSSFHEGFVKLLETFTYIQFKSILTYMSLSTEII